MVAFRMLNSATVVFHIVYQPYNDVSQR